MTDRFEQIEVGDRAEFSHKLTVEDVDAFSRLTGDDNPLHMDESYAAGTDYGKRVVHGMLTASFLSTVIGTRLPGPGALWFEQTLRFLAPVRIGETISIEVTVTQKSPAERILVLSTVILGESARKVLTGEAKVKVLPAAQQQELPEDRPGAVVVSGAATGIGAAIARAVAADGRPVVLNYRSSAAAARALVTEIREGGGHAIAVEGDLSDGALPARLVDHAVSRFGALWGVVNNASPPAQDFDLVEVPWDAFERHLTVQVRATLQLCQAAIPVMLDNGGGAIVSISSTAATNPPPRLLPYSMAKAALEHMTLAMANELGPRGIRANVVAPGMTSTSFIADFPAKAKALARMGTPLRKLAQPAQIGSVVAFLLSDAASHITGEVVRVSGGAHQ